MRILLRLLSYLLLLPLLLWLVLVNVRLYHQPAYQLVEGQSLHSGIQAQLAWLSQVLPAYAPADPAAQLEAYTLYGLAACDLLAVTPSDSYLYTEALAHVDSALAWTAALSGAFESPQALPQGAQYHGWTSYLLGRKLEALPTSARTPADMQRLREACDQTVALWRKLGHPYPARTAGEAYAMDGLLCAAAVALHERLAPGRYAPTLATWLTQVRTRLDTDSLLPYQVAVADGQPLVAAQGHSLSPMLVWLADLAPQFAQTQFMRYRQQLGWSYLGIRAIRAQAPAQADPPAAGAAPVWGQVSLPASLRGLRTLARYQADEDALIVRNLTEALAMGWHWQGEKRYWLASSPNTQAWIVWAYGCEANAAQRLLNRSQWRWPLHLLSLGIMLLLGLLLLLLHRATRPPSNLDGNDTSAPSASHNKAQSRARPRTLSTQRSSPDPPQWELPPQA